MPLPCEHGNDSEMGLGRALEPFLLGVGTERHRVPGGHLTWRCRRQRCARYGSSPGCERHLVIPQFHLHDGLQHPIPSDVHVDHDCRPIPRGVVTIVWNGAVQSNRASFQSSRSCCGPPCPASNSCCHSLCCADPRRPSRQPIQPGSFPLSPPLHRGASEARWAGRTRAPLSGSESRISREAVSAWRQAARPARPPTLCLTCVHRMRHSA